MAVFSAIKKRIKKLRTPSGQTVSAEPINDGHTYGLAMEIFGAFEAYTTLALADYRDLEIKNPRIGASFRTRRYKTLSYGWKIDPVSSEKSDKEVADFVKYVLENIEEQTFEQSLRWLMYALRDEYAVEQIIPKIFDSGPWAGKAGLAWLRPITRFSIEPILEHKRLMGFKIGGKQYEASEFLVYTHEPTDTKPMGTSLFAALVWYNWFFKNGMKFWSAYLDRFGMPIAVATIENGLSDEDKELVKTAIEDINAGYSIRLPQNAKIELLKATTSGKTGFERYVEFCGNMVTEILLGQTLSTGISENSTRAQASVHAETLREYNRVDGQEISGAVNRQLIPRLVEWNFPGRDCPKFRIITEPPKDQDKEAKRASLALRDGLALKKDETYASYGYKIPEEGDEVIVFRQQTATNPNPDNDDENDDGEESEEFSEANISPEARQNLNDTDEQKAKFSEAYRKASAKLPDMIMSAIDIASRGLSPDPIDIKKKK